MHRNELRLLKLVNTLLDFSRIEAGRVNATFEPTDLAALTTDLASAFRSATERAGLQLIVDCPPLPAPVYVDREMWEKIVLNLLSNAFKFTFQGSIGVAARAGLTRTSSFACGTRVSASRRERSRPRLRPISPHRTGRGAHARRVRHRPGACPRARRHPRRHGRVASVLREGTVFSVRLPVGTAHLAGEHIAPASGQPRRARPAPGLGATPYVEEALRWLPSETLPSTRHAASEAAPRRPEFWSPTTTPTCATT